MLLPLLVQLHWPSDHWAVRSPSQHTQFLKRHVKSDNRDVCASLTVGALTLKVLWHATLWMLLYSVSWPLLHYLKTFKKLSRITAAMSQSHNELSTNVPFLRGGSRWRVGVFGPEQLAATVPCAPFYSGCIGMVSCTQLFAVFCKYSRTLRVIWRESCSSISK